MLGDDQEIWSFSPKEVLLPWNRTKLNEVDAVLFQTNP